MNAKVSSAISSLEQEVLKTLLGGPLQPQDIATILGTEVIAERPNGDATGTQNPIIVGVLWGLERRKLVKQPNPRDSWEITDEGKKCIQKLEDVKKHELVRYAIEKMNEEDYPAANVAFSKVIEHNKQNPVAHICRAFCKYELLVGLSAEEYQEQMQTIVSDLEKALELSKCNLITQDSEVQNV